MSSSFPVILGKTAVGFDVVASSLSLTLACFLALSASVTFTLDLNLFSSFLGGSLARFGSFNMLDGGCAGTLDDDIG